MKCIEMHSKNCMGQIKSNRDLIDDEYKNWLTELKLRVRNVQLKAAVVVNKELLEFYWGLGADIVSKQTFVAWCDGFLKKLSVDLMVEFPEMKGFSRRNFEIIRKWYLFWCTDHQMQKHPRSYLLCRANYEKQLESKRFGSSNGKWFV